MTTLQQLTEKVSDLLLAPVHHRSLFPSEMCKKEGQYFLWVPYNNRDKFPESLHELGHPDILLELERECEVIQF
jgi:hypothetical protein